MNHTLVTKEYRIWCKSCKDFTLHDQVFCDENTHPRFKALSFNPEKPHDAEYICKCGCQYTDVTIGEMDADKVSEQRKRFKLQRSRDFKNRYNVFLTMGFGETSNESHRIVESDAGLKALEKLEEEHRAKIKAQKKEELLRFKNVGRNDTCLCGTGLKYKKCCLLKHDLF